MITYNGLLPASVPWNTGMGQYSNIWPKELQKLLRACGFNHSQSKIFKKTHPKTQINHPQNNIKPPNHKQTQPKNPTHQKDCFPTTLTAIFSSVQIKMKKLKSGEIPHGHTQTVGTLAVQALQALLFCMYSTMHQKGFSLHLFLANINQTKRVSVQRVFGGKDHRSLW